MRLFKPTGVYQILVERCIYLCMKQINVRCHSIFQQQFLIKVEKLCKNFDSSVLGQRLRRSWNSKIDSSMKCLMNCSQANQRLSGDGMATLRRMNL